MPLFFTKEIKDKNEKYIEPDGAGIIYPYVATKDWNSVYRIEAITKTKVNFVCLEAAVKIMKKKYPYFFSRISTHGNKYVFKRGYASNVVVKDSEMCKPFDIKDEDTLLRVVYRNNAIGAEFFHSVTDGHGAQMFFDIDTPRNAALYFLVSVKPKEVHDFKSLVAVVRKQFELQLTKENMQNLAFSNVKCAKMKAYKMLPLGLKKIALNIGYTTFGENQFTSTLTNLGNIILDSKIADELESVYFVLGKEKTKPFNIAVSSFKDETRLMISSAIDSTDLVKAMRERLLCDGVVSSSAVKSSAAEKAKYPSVS